MRFLLLVSLACGLPTIANAANCHERTILSILSSSSQAPAATLKQLQRQMCSTAAQQARVRCIGGLQGGLNSSQFMTMITVENGKITKQIGGSRTGIMYKKPDAAKIQQCVIKSLGSTAALKGTVTLALDHNYDCKPTMTKKPGSWVACNCPPKASCRPRRKIPDPRVGIGMTAGAYRRLAGMEGFHGFYGKNKWQGYLSLLKGTVNVSDHVADFFATRTTAGITPDRVWQRNLQITAMARRIFARVFYLGGGLGYRHLTNEYKTTSYEADPFAREPIASEVAGESSASNLFVAAKAGVRIWARAKYMAWYGELYTSYQVPFSSSAETAGSDATEQDLLMQRYTGFEASHPYPGWIHVSAGWAF